MVCAGKGRTGVGTLGNGLRKRLPALRLRRLGKEQDRKKQMSRHPCPCIMLISSIRANRKPSDSGSRPWP